MPTQVIPYLSIQGAASALEFYKKAFGAKEELRLTEPGTGRIGHAEITIGGSRIMLADEYPEYGIVSPKTLGGAGLRICLIVDDVDAVVARAVDAGAKLTMPVRDQFYGDRSGKVEDPFGHTWYIQTHKEDMSAEEMQRRYDEELSAQ
ncbi:MAG TPA: VOC family protein [Thermoanaerobaculia bacterium]|nr:VOC family protein [Thermoanaerobaculia bacterium]